MSAATELTPEQVVTTVRQLLETGFWLPTLESRTLYQRLQDDHDGTGEGSIAVAIGEDGDAWVQCTTPRMLRFRVPMIGGGASPRTRAALVILAEAIRLDNELCPMNEATTCDGGEGG